MKHFYTLLLALFITGLGFGQGVEDFGNLCTSGCSPSNSSYDSRSWTGQDGSTWTATRSRTDQPINGNAITMNDDTGNTFVQSGTISGGIGDFTITTQRKFSGGSGNIDILINGVSIGTVPYGTSSQTSTISGINISGDIVIRIDNNIGGSSGGGADRVAIDDVTWTAFNSSCTLPTTQASAYNTTAITTTSATLNWTSGDGDEVLVVVKEGAAVDTDPANGTSYTGNTLFGSGTELGTGNFTVFAGTTTNSTNITGLTEGTTYHVAVYEYNTTDTCYNLVELTGSFTTPCASITSFPFTEGFESGVPPSCWTSFPGTNNLGLGESWTSDSDSNSGSFAAVIADDDASGVTEDWLVTPALDLSLLSNTELSFFSKSFYTSDFGTVYTVRVSTTSQTNHSSFTTVDTFNETDFSSTAYSQFTVNLSAYDGQTVYIAFVQTQDFGDAWLLDDVEVKQGTSKNATIVESGFDETDNIDYLAYDASSGLLDSNALKIGEFIIQDAGASPTDIDALTTTLTDITFDITGFDNIAALAIFDGPANISEQTTIGASASFTGLSLSAPDDGTYTFSVYATFTSTVTDNEQIQLTISSATADTNGSTFADGDAGGASTSITGDDNRIEVTATDLIFDTDTSDSVLNIVMSPAPSVLAVDSNVNIDLDFMDIIVLSPSTTGIFDAVAVTSAPAVDGEALFNALIFDTVGTGYVLTAASGLLNTDSSNSFNVTAVAPTCNSIFSDDFSGDLSNWSNTSDWTINASGELKHDLNNVSGSSYIYSDLGNQDYTSGNYEWQFCIRNGSWDPSGSNKFAFNLFSDTFNLLFEPTGYAVGVNQSDTSDDLKLYAVNNGAYTEILASPFDWSESDNVCIRVTRSTSGDWELFYDDNGSGETSAGTVTNTDFTSGNYIGTTFNYSSSRAGLLYIDDISLCKTDGTVNFVYDGTNWLPVDPNGISTSLDQIIVQSSDATISSNTSANTVTVNPGASLTVDSGITLTIADATDGLTLESTSSSYASLIRNGTITGTINYERFVNQIGSGTAAGNDLISIPLTEFGLNFQSFLSFGNPSNRTIIPANGANTVHAFAPYDNVNQQFVNLPTYLETAPPDPAAEPLISGVGYRAASTSGATVTFTGEALSNDVAVTITTPNVTLSQWNLIGNPYPSYLDAAKFLAANSGPMEDSAEAIYAYNSATYTGGAATTGNYTIINSATIAAFPGENFNIAPGQGFFVPADITPANFTGTIDFITGPTASDDMRTTSGSDDYITGRNNDLTYVLKLALNTDATTTFFFNDNASRGLDAGYDAKVFGGNTPMFSHLVEDNTGVSMALQALAISDLSDVSIPLGVNANQGEQLNFSVALSTLPNTVSVYLDDTLNNTSTLLNTSDYVLTPNANLSGTGRFYLRFGNNALSVSETSFDHLNIYTNDKAKTVVILGQLLEPTTAHIYDLQGRSVLSTNLMTSLHTQTIDISNLSIGVYVVELQNASQTKTQKVIIK
ncbi:MAG: choice-of-anchor J domain-containing protein [Winogradskyella sp.]|uniref:choice-of-anchor J domain-containing protein n=1 Tax=Winogradskyella sp. TaxID=1883156 RepID=UPI00385C71AF